MGLASSDHRIIVWSQLEGTFKAHLAQPFCNKQRHLLLDQVAPSNLALNGSRDGASGQPVPVPHHPLRKMFLPYIQSKSTPFQFKTIGPCPVTTALGK